MKKISILLASLFIFITFAVTGYAAPPRLVDEAALLTADEASELQTQLDEISERLEFDIVIVTVDSLGGKSAMEYADDYFDYNGYGFGEGGDGCILLLSMEERDWWVSTKGYGIYAITDAGLEYMSEQFLPYISNGDYAGGFKVFAQLCDEFVYQAMNDEPYDTNNIPIEADPVSRLILALIVGLLGAFIPVFVMRSKLKSVHTAGDANNYIKDGSVRVNAKKDIFLYSDVTRTRKATESGSTTHTSSSGSTHGGGGGKF